jgi:pimeloyl-ACP methyl ester carboxylesterase
MARYAVAQVTIVVIHGPWLTPRSWDRWIERYQRRDVRVIAPAWPGMEAEVEVLNADPSPIASLTVEQIIDHYESIITALERPPVIMGHSLGGTLTQILLDRGLGTAGVGVAAPTVQGVRDLPLTTVKVVPPVLNPFRTGETVSLTPGEFHYALANTLSRDESDVLHARYAVPAPGGVLSEHAFVSTRRDAVTNDGVTKRGRAPLLLVGFGEDHVVPPRAMRHEGLHDDRTGSTVELVEFSGHPHFLGAPGWEKVADYALAWIGDRSRDEGVR